MENHDVRHCGAYLRIGFGLLGKGKPGRVDRICIGRIGFVNKQRREMKEWVIIKEIEGEGYIIEDCCGDTHFITYETYHKVNGK